MYVNSDINNAATILPLLCMLSKEATSFAEILL